MTQVSVIRLGWAQNVATPSTVNERASANLFSTGARHCLDPYQMPPVALPRAYVPRMNPASGLCPKCWAKATVLRSIDTNIAPTLIAGFSLLEAQARPGRRTEAMQWLSSGIAVGVAAGASVVGFVIDAHGARFGYAFAALCGAASAATCLAGLLRLRPASAAAGAEA